MKRPEPRGASRPVGRSPRPAKTTQPNRPEPLATQRANPAAPRPKAAKPANRTLKNERNRLKALRQQASGGRNSIKDEVSRFREYSRRRRITIIAIVSPFVALILLVIATLTTPLLAINKIDVEGTQRIKKVSILNALKPEIGTPLTLVDSSSVANALSSFNLIESFAVIAKPPHTLLVRITERQPICIVTLNGVAYLYDPAGVQIGVAKSLDNYPVISISGDPKTDRHFKQAMDVVLALPAKLLPRVAVVQAKTKDDVRMQLRGSARQQIIWGDESQSVLKSKVLSALLKHVKQSVSAVIDVSSPSAPVVRYTNF